MAVAGFFVTIAIPAFGFAAEDLMPLRPATPPPTLPELMPVRPPERKTSVRPGPQKNIVRVRIPSPSRYDSETGLPHNAAASATHPPEATAIRPSAAPAAVEAPTATPAAAGSPVPPKTPAVPGARAATTAPGVPMAPTVPNMAQVSGESAVTTEPSGPAVTSAPAVAAPVHARPAAARASAASTVSSATVRSGTGVVTTSRPAEPAYQVHGSLAVPTIILPPVAPGNGGGGTGQALIPGLVTPEDLAKPALALQEFNETIERDMADLVDFDAMDATALGSSVAEFLAGPVAPSVAPTALPARVMHGDDIVQDADRDLAAGAVGPFLPIPSTGSRSEDISAMVPPSMLMGSRLPAGPGTPTRSRPVARAPSRFDPAAEGPTTASRRTPPMAPVTLPPPLSFAQSARPTEARHGTPMPPPPAASFSPTGAGQGHPTLTPVPEARPESAARLAGFDQLLGRSQSERVEPLADATMSIPGAAQRATTAAVAGEPVGIPTHAPVATTLADGASRYPLPALPPAARLKATTGDEAPEAQTGARPDSRLDMAAGIDTLKVRVREQVREDTAEKAASQAPRPDEARLYNLPEAPVQARKGSITDFQPTIARPKAIVRDEDSDLIVVPANGVRPAGTKAPRRLAAAKPSAATTTSASGDGRLQAGQVESIRIPPKTNIPLPPGLFDDEELAELERRGYRVERPVVRARDEADDPIGKEKQGAAETPSAGKKSSGVTSGAPSGPVGTVGKAAAEATGKNTATNETPTEKLANKPDADSGSPPALSPSLFRNRKKPAAEAAPPDDVPGEAWEREPVTGFTPVRQARNLFNSILGR